MAAVSKTVLSLRVFGDDLEPDEISRLLGSSPTTSCRRGDVRKVLRGREVIEKRGSWILEVEERLAGGLSAQIIEALSRLTLDLSVWEALGQRYECDVFSGLFMKQGNEGEELTVKAMAMLVERNLEIGLDIYEPYRES